jgi:ketosteroid isomerase-like protein
MVLILAAAGVVAAPECRHVPMTQMIARYGELQKVQDVDAIARLFGKDGEVVNPGSAPVRGAAAVRAFLGGFKGFTVLTNDLTVSNIDKAGADWHVAGRFHQTGSTPDGKSYDVTGTFDSSWVCTGDGWRVRRMATGN